MYQNQCQLHKGPQVLQASSKKYPQNITFTSQTTTTGPLLLEIRPLLRYFIFLQQPDTTT